MSFGTLEASQMRSDILSLDEIYDNYQAARAVKNYSDVAQWAVEIARLDKSGFFVNDIYEHDPLLAQRIKDKTYPYEHSSSRAYRVFPCVLLFFPIKKQHLFSDKDYDYRVRGFRFLR